MFVLHELHLVSVRQWPQPVSQYGRFVGSFSIPEDAEDSKVNAEFKDGVLRVHLAKSEKARPKQIEVKVS